MTGPYSPKVGPALYIVAVVGYVALSFWTQKFLTWTWGPTYFLVVLEVLPRTVALVRRHARREVRT